LDAPGANPCCLLDGARELATAKLGGSAACLARKVRAEIVEIVITLDAVICLHLLKHLECHLCSQPKLARAQLITVPTFDRANSDLSPEDNFAHSPYLINTLQPKHLCLYDHEDATKKD